MGRWPAIALLVVSVPGVALAQRVGGIGGRGGGGGGMGRSRTGGDMTSQSGIAIPKQVNAINLLIEHRQELVLSDTQFKRVIAIKRTLDSTNAPSMRKLDSVERLFKKTPLFSEPNAERRDSLAAGRALVAETNADVHENIAAARERAYALLSMTQIQLAQQLEAKAQKAIDDEQQHADGGRGHGGAGAGRPPDG